MRDLICIHVSLCKTNDESFWLMLWCVAAAPPTNRAKPTRKSLELDPSTNCQCYSAQSALRVSSGSHLLVLLTDNGVVDSECTAVLSVCKGTCGPEAIPLIPSLPHLLLYLWVSFTFPFSLSYALCLFSCFFIPSHFTRIVPLCFLWPDVLYSRQLNLALVLCVLIVF